MIFLLLGVVAVLFFVFLVVEKDIVSPEGLLLMSFLIGSIAIALNIFDWEVEVNPKLFFYIALVLVSFSVSFYLVYGGIRQKGKHNLLDLKKAGGRRLLPILGTDYNYPSNLLIALSCICGFLYVAQVVAHVGFDGDMARFLRKVYESGLTTESNFFLHQPLKITIAIAHVSVFEIMMMRYVKQSKEGMLRVLIPLVPFVICTLICTDRNVFIRFVLYLWCIWVLFYRYRNPDKTRKIFLYSAVFVLVAFALFYILGKTKSYTSDLHRMIGLYAGSGLYNFNLSIEDLESSNLHFGGSTFSTLLEVLNNFGILPDDLAGGSNYSSKLIVFHSATGYVYASNVYSAMLPYVEDFGYFGVILFPAILGVLYGFLYKYVQKGAFGYSWFLYALLIYPLVYFVISEQFFTRLHLGFVYEIGWATLFFLFAYYSQFIRLRISERNKNNHPDKKENK